MTDHTITATLVAEEDRLEFLPKHLGLKNLMFGQNLPMTYLDRLSADYGGGFWEFYELSNGGWYMAPRSDEDFRMSWNGNGYEGTMSADAAGITASLFAINQLANHSRDDRLINAYYHLRDFAAQHAEAAEIYAAID